jgi:hypothetical protein
MRGRRSRTIEPGQQGLPEERKALVVRYMLDAEEAMKREQLAAEATAQESEDDGAAPQPQEEQESLLRSAPASRPERYVIKLRGVGFLWRWAVFESIGAGSNGAQPPLTTDPARAVAAGLLPRLSEQAARRAAERAARGAFRQAIASE